MGKIKFTKAVAAGNDFIIVDNRTGHLKEKELARFTKKVCDRKRAIGADGVLVVAGSRKADFKMRIFNSDGSEAGMCGNGSRCAALFAAVKKIAGSKMSIETLAGIIDAVVKNDTVKVKLTDPKEIKWNFCLMINKCPFRVNFVDTGVPHVIHFTDDLDKVDVRNIGSHIRHHGDFSPEGTNADFVKVVGRDTIKIRTYERGVEDETLACGTGAVASAIIAAEAEKMSSPVTVETQGGEKMKVYFEMVDGNFRNVFLEGRAELIYEGKLISG
ncbi:MAG: diaminopimelate epimerase [Candidatus Omnitrophica bacterium]|nr:diaminopimelate epimerase [Candidatus Omnitrophota bacterium]MDD5436478.1 diaminopimelate epimerase [Candidatus Omnitrophota bacterium]